MGIITTHTLWKGVPLSRPKTGDKTAFRLLDAEYTVYRMLNRIRRTLMVAIINWPRQQSNPEKAEE